MADLIDRAELLKDFDTSLDYGMTPYECLCSCTNRIIGAAAVDATPVVHGKWISIPHKSARVCSQCESDEPYKNAPDDADVFYYCPHCGALMDGGAK